MHSGVITADIADHSPIFLISKDSMLYSSKEPIQITKREINDKFSLKLFSLLLTGNMCLTKFPKSCVQWIFKNFFWPLQWGSSKSKDKD